MICRSAVAQGATFCLTAMTVVALSGLAASQGLDHTAILRRAVDSWQV